MRVPHPWHTHQPGAPLRHKHRAEDGTIEVRQLIVKYRVVTYMRIEPDDDILYDTFPEAEADVENLELMQPDDIHTVEEVQEEKQVDHKE